MRARVSFLRVTATRLAWGGLIVLALVSPASPASNVTSSYRALGRSVPVPVGWQVGEYQPITVTVIDPDGSRVDEILGTAGTVMNPPVWIPHGPRITIEQLPDSVDVVVRSRCRPPAIVQPAFEGPTAIAGHAGSYQYLCSPRTFIGPEWTVLIPASGQPGAWRLTYLGAQQIGSGSLSRAFATILAAFSP